MSDKKKKYHSKNKYGLSRDIPDHVKLEVRKRCGFGCVVCGLGIYDYEHFSPEFKDIKVEDGHKANGITLLCPNHHRKKKGRLAIETIIKFNANPKALRKGFSSDRFDLSSKNLIVQIGGISFESTPTMLQIGDEPIITIEPSDDEDEPFLLSLKLRNKNGEVILDIDRNEWKTSVDLWDCKAEGKTIEIRSAPRKIELILRQEPPNKICIERILMHHRGYIIKAPEEGGTKIVFPAGNSIIIAGLKFKMHTIGLLLKGNEFLIGAGVKPGGYIFPSEDGGTIDFSKFSTYTNISGLINPPD